MIIINSKEELLDILEDGEEIKTFPSKFGTYHNHVFQRDENHYLVQYETVPEHGVQWNGPISAIEVVRKEVLKTIWAKA